MSNSYKYHAKFIDFSEELKQTAIIARKKQRSSEWERQNGPKTQRQEIVLKHPTPSK